MKKRVLITLALLATAFALYSFGGYKIWTEQDLVTTTIEDEIERYTVLDNAMFRIVYPKAWKSWTRRDDIISEIIIEGDSIKMDVGIVSYYPLLGEKLKNTS